MADIVRISPEETKARLSSGSALLVCAYDSNEKFSRFHLEGAISLSDFKERVADLSNTQEIIFYCN